MHTVLSQYEYLQRSFFYDFQTMPPQPQPTAVKGDPIYIKGGKYKGYNGWMNDAKAQPSKMVYVIINFDGEEKAKRVRKSSIGPRPGEPSTYEEAAIQQIDAIEYHLTQAALHLAKCGVENWDEVARIFKIMGQAAQNELNALGPAATYYNVVFGDDE